MCSSAVRTMCQQCVRWAVAKRKWWSLLHNDRAAACDIADEAESSKFLESSDVALFLPSSYSRELMKIKTHWVCICISESKQSWNYFLFLHWLQLFIVSGSQLEYAHCDADSTTVAPWPCNASILTRDLTQHSPKEQAAHRTEQNGKFMQHQ